MSKKRRTSLRENEAAIGELRGINGGRLCRYCGREVEPPRRTFCSDVCIHEYRIRSDIKYMRHQVYLRDCGICALCGTDTRYVLIELENAASKAIKETEKWGAWWTHPGYQEVLMKYHLTLAEAGKSLWQADHIVAVIRGGGESGLDNIRTLCITCHKDVTRELARERARAKRQARKNLGV